MRLTVVPSGRKKIAPGKEQGGSGIPPLNQPKQQWRDASATLDHESQNTASLERAKEGAWPVVPLSEVVGINPRPGSDELADDSLASFIPMRCVEEESGRFEPLGDRKIAEVRKGYTPFRDGDVIFAKVTPCMENGKAAVMKGLTNGIGFGSTEFFALRPKDRLDANYLFHFALQSSFRQQAARNMTGAVGLRRVPKLYLEQQPIPLPPLPEQRRIVAEIEKQFTRLEAGVAALRRVQANLKRYRAAVLKAACEGRLVPTEAELARVGRVPPRGVRPKAKNAASGDASYNGAPYETGEALLARILTEHRQNWQGRGQYKEPASLDTTSLPPVSEGWTVASIDQLAAATMIGLDRGRAQQSDDPTSGVPYIKMNNVTMDGQVFCDDLVYVPVSREEATRFAVDDGDILFNTRNSKELVGKVGLVRSPSAGAIYNNNLMRIRLAEGVSPAFLTLQMCSHEFRRRMELVKKATTNVAAVYAKDLLPLAIALPPLAEQTRIVAEVERRLSVVEELESVVSANLQRATRFRQSILQKAFTGGLSS